MVNGRTVWSLKRPRGQRRFLLQYGVGLDRIIRWLLIRTIALYQRYLSPHKGFACAYRVLHGSHSCSQGTKEILRNYSLGEALPRIRQQFRACRDASSILRDRHYNHRCRTLHDYRSSSNLLFPSLSDRILLSRTGDSDGYEDSRRDRRRKSGGGTAPYQSTWCDCCDAIYCFDATPDGSGGCDLDACGLGGGCDGCEGCACDCG